MYFNQLKLNVSAFFVCSTTLWALGCPWCGVLRYLLFALLLPTILHDLKKGRNGVLLSPPMLK